MPLYSIDYLENNTDAAVYRYFYTTHEVRNFLYNNRNKIHDVIIYLFNSMTEISEKDLRD